MVVNNNYIPITIEEIISKVQVFETAQKIIRNSSKVRFHSVWEGFGIKFVYLTYATRRIVSVRGRKELRQDGPTDRRIDPVIALWLTTITKKVSKYFKKNIA